MARSILYGLRSAIGRGELAELGDGGGDDLEGLVDLSARGVAAQAEAEAGASVFGAKSDGGQDVGGFDRAAGTGGARAAG